MLPNMPNGLDHLRGTMQIGEASKRTSLTPDAIRFYERRSLLPKPERTAGRFRLYTDADVERLSFIRQMQGLGFSLREIGQLLDLRERRFDACHEVKDLLDAKLKKVRAKVKELASLERELIADLRKCNRELKHRKKHEPISCPVLASSHTRRNHKC